ncbi:hypothetical protein FKM82_025991 [Ascaphus truei]
MSRFPRCPSGVRSWSRVGSPHLVPGLGTIRSLHTHPSCPLISMSWDDVLVDELPVSQIRALRRALSLVQRASVYWNVPYTVQIH